GKNGEPDVVIGIVLAIFSIQTFTIEERRAVNEIKLVFLRREVDRGIVAIRAEKDRQVVPNPAHALQINEAVPGDNDSNLIAARTQSGWKRAEDVSQAAGLGQRRGLRSNHQNTGHTRILANRAEAGRHKLHSIPRQIFKIDIAARKHNPDASELPW